MRWVPPVDRASSSTPPPRSIVLAARSHRRYLAALEGFEYPSTPGSFRTESREEALAWHEAQAKAKEFVVFGEVAAIALTIASFAATAMAVAGAALGDGRGGCRARRLANLGQGSTGPRRADHRRRARNLLLRAHGRIGGDAGGSRVQAAVLRFSRAPGALGEEPVRGKETQGLPFLSILRCPSRS